MKRRCILRRVLSSALAAAMLVTMAPAVSYAAEETDKKDTLLASYPLLSDVSDVSGKGNNGTAVGNVTYDSKEGMTLPGGGTKANYVEIPGSMFEKQENLTVSGWIKSNTNPGNYAALFFGTTENLPTGYWLFNPARPNDGNFKSVFTNSVSTGSPWSTEVGVTSVSTTGYKGNWVHYTTVITENSITGYINGEKIGTASKSRKVSDFGTGLKAYIGRSSYGDPDYAGTFQDVRVYAEAKDEAGVADIFSEALTDSTKQIVVAKEKEKLSLGNSAAVFADMTLPGKGKYNTTITWTSDNTAVVSNDGKVTLGTEAKDVKLTAKIELDGVSATKEFNVHVVKKDEVLNAILEELYIPYIMSEGTKLPQEVQGIPVVWTADLSSVLAEDGSIVIPEDRMKDGMSEEVTLTASVNVDGQKAEKSFKIRIIEKDSEYVMSYTRSGVSEALGQSMHLALSQDGTDYTALHNNTGIYFAKADLPDFGAGTTKTMVTPYLFRMADKKIGVIAVQNDGKVLYAVTEDLMEYEDKVIDLHTSTSVSAPQCEYNGTEYIITWQGSDGKLYQNTTKDFVTISNPEEISSRTDISVTANITNAVPCNVLPVTKKEAAALRSKLSPLENTGVEEKDYSFSVQTGGSLSEEDMKSTITAKYNDGTTDEIPIEWDMSAVDYSKEGTYKITGKAKLTEYPVLNGRADPVIYKYKDKYYFIATGETQNQSQICIREADTPAGLFQAQDHEIVANVGKPRWAPELHEIGGKLYILYAIGDVWSQVQSHIMELKEGGDPTVKEDWKEPVRVTKKDGSNLYDEGITLDMTYFEVDGIHYLSWAQRKIQGGNGTSDLWIATINPENPYQLTSDPVCILRCQYGWDRTGTTVDEGPYVIQRDGKVYMTFSGSSVSNTYLVGLLTAEQGADLLDAANWKETGYPILTAESVAKEYGPGHSCFSVDEDGRPIFVFHMKPNGGTRSATVRRVHFGPDGAPVLDMTIDKELKAEYRNVEGKVRVGINRDELQTEVDNAVTDKEKYTETTWKVYEEALKAAKEVLNKQEATQEEIDKAAKTLKDAKEALEEKPDRSFVDVDKETGNWYYDAVYYNFDRGIMNGVNETHFEPLSNLARAQFAIILHNMEGKPAVSYEPKFRDVADGQWYTNAILWASSKGIVTGYTDGSEKFGWGDNILREQMAVMMYRYVKNFKGYDVSESADFDKFTDAALVNDYAKEAMKWAVGTGIITGKDLDGDGTPESIDPLGNASRAECVIIIQRFLEKYN